MPAKQILVLGGGFAGLWSAVGAARKLDELGRDSRDAQITLVNRDAFHSIRVRNYEADLDPIRVPLDDVLQPVGVARVEADVSSIDFATRSVAVTASGVQRSLKYDRLVFALGSQLFHPSIPGLTEHSFDVDTYSSALRLENHLRSLPAMVDTPGRHTVVVVGAGLTGIEVATEMPERLRKVFSAAKLSADVRVILVDHNPHVGSDMGESARPVIEDALRSLGVETKLGVQVQAVDATGVTFSTGETIATSTVIWCAGMRAHPLTSTFPVQRDRFGRLPVDEFLRVKGVDNVFAAGDAAACLVDPAHSSVMSCQHSRPMGRFAGHNVVADLFNLPLLPLEISWYVTVLDLGPCGAVYTEGWDRHVILQGEEAKKVKQTINCQRIYPPLNRNRHDILAAAAPVIQQPPPNK